MRGIYAIARNLFIEVLRMRVLMAVTVLILTSCTVFFAMWLSGSGAADARVQTFLSYSLSMIANFLSFFTIFIAISSITRDISSREIFTISTKPVSRLQILAGKLLGMMFINLVLLIVAAIAVYLLAKFYLPGSNVSAYERMRLNNLVFTARQGVKPEMPDITAAVKKQVDKRVAEKLRTQPQYYRNNPDLIKQMRHTLTRDITKQMELALRSAGPGRTIIFHFRNVKPSRLSNDYIFVRYKQDVSMNPPDLQLVNEWAFGPKDPRTNGARPVVPTRLAIRTVHEMPLPPDAVSKQGDLYIVYHNSMKNGYITVIFPKKDGIEVLYKAGGFEANFLRTIVMIYLRLLFLSILGIAAGAWLSFPVAVLVVLVIFVMGLSSNFIQDAMRWEVSKEASVIARSVMQILPNFSHFDPVPLIEKGRLVSYSLLGWCFVIMVMLKGGIVALFGYLVFKFRELARVII